MRGRLTIWLGCACATVLAGCTHHLHSPAIEILWADFNIYGRPALFFDHKSHYPSKPQHVKYFLWRHQPDSYGDFASLPPTAAQPEMIFEDPSLQPSFVPQPGYESTQSEQTPPPRLPSAPEPNPIPGPYEDDSPREEAPPPPPKVDQPLRYTVPNGPTAGTRSHRANAAQSAGWQSESGVPVKSLLFAHP